MKSSRSREEQLANLRVARAKRLGTDEDLRNAKREYLLVKARLAEQQAQQFRAEAERI